MTDALTNDQRVCRDCEHSIPWDWVFCAWCGCENDRPVPPCATCDGRGEVGGFVNAESGYQTDPCPDCSVDVVPK